MGLPSLGGTRVCTSRVLTPHPLRRPLLRSSALRKPQQAPGNPLCGFGQSRHLSGPQVLLLSGVPTPECREGRLATERTLVRTVKGGPR